MIRLLRKTFLTALLLALVGGAGLYAAVPTIERRMTFHPLRYDPRTPWRLPADTTDVRFAAADGVRLHGWFLTGRAPRNGGTVLYFHGNGGTLVGSTGDAEVLRAHGHDVFVVDYRGYGQSEGATLGESTLALDGEAALRWLTADRGIDPASVVLFGHSLGTTVAADLAVAQPCRAVVLVAPLASARRQAQSLGLFAWLPGFYFDRMANRFDTEGKIGRARCPVLVAHGDRDGTISVDHGRAVYAAARPPKTLVVVPGGDHVLQLAARQDYAQQVVDFLRAPTHRETPNGVRPGSCQR